MSVDTHQEKLKFQAEVAQVLDIVVHSLYSNKEIFLRELVSNASDAIDKLRFEALSDSALYEGDTELKIIISLDKEAKTVTISDNGIGMTREEMVENLGTIAKSGTREFLSRLTGDQKKDSHLIGQFGVGFYSAFIVADSVTVNSRRAGLGKEHGVSWTSSGKGEYTIANIEKANRGTDVILHIKPEDEEYLDPWRIRNVVAKYSDHIGIPIFMHKYQDDKPLPELEMVNRAQALWTLPKNSIKEEEYKEFYMHLTHDYQGPLAWSLHKIEGTNVDYITLLYIPAHSPQDIWLRDTRYGLKLYVQRVFIMDKVDQFLPYYMRFMRGIVDTSALPLNISRELLQDHPVLHKLRSALVRHVFDFLDRLADQEPEKYKQFWKEFGAILKEGIGEDMSNAERIVKLVRYSTTRSDEQSVSLDTYIKRMPEQQKKIYYITAENLNAAKSSPHLEIFNKNNIEVILMTDKVDEWILAYLPEVQGKTWQSIAKGDLQLEELKTESKEEKQAEEEKFKEQTKTYQALLNNMQKILTGKVKEVRLSNRLVESPICLVRDQNAIGPQMEKLLKASNQPVNELPPILELNPEHEIIKALVAMDEKRLTSWTEVLYEEALLAEGSNLFDPPAFVKRLNNLWMEIFAQK
jgi:molecular chaperone HtpG